MILLALVASICAVALAALFWVMCGDGDIAVSAVLAFVLFPVLVFAIMAWREAL